jgi:outer membrane protein with beta-barrel domain
MKQLMYKGILTAALLVLLAKPVLATDAFNRPGPYLGLGMAGGLSEFSGAARGAEDSLGFSFRGGYRFNDYFAVEGLYEYMDEFSKTLEGSSGERAKATIGMNNFSLMTKVILPTLGLSQLQPFVAGGIGFMEASGDAEVRHGEIHRGGNSVEFAGRVDGGVDYFLTPEISTFFDVGYVIPTDKFENLNYLSLGMGVKYNF